MRIEWHVIWFCMFAPLLFSACVLWLFRLAEYLFTPISFTGSYTPVFLPGAILAVSLITGYCFSFIVFCMHSKGKV